MTRKLLFFVFLVGFGLFMLTGKVAAANVTETTGGHVFLYGDLNDSPHAFIYYPGGVYYLSDFMGQGPGYYVFIAASYDGNTSYSVNLDVNMILDNGAGVGVGMGPVTSFSLAGGGYVYVYRIDTELDWADSQKPASFNVATAYIVYSTTVSSTATEASITFAFANTNYSTAFSAKTAYTAIALQTNLDGVIIPLPQQGTQTWPAITFSAVVDTVTAAYTAAQAYNDEVTISAPTYFIAEGSVSFSVSPVALVIDKGLPVISVGAIDALNGSPINQISLIIDSQTYSNVATLPTGTYTVTVTASAYDPETFVVALTNANQTFETGVKLFPTTAIFSVGFRGAINGYEMGVYTEVLTISPRSSYTNNVSLVFQAWPFQPTVIIDGSTVPLTGNQVVIGSVASERYVTIVISATTTTQAVANIVIVGNDAFTGTASMTIAEHVNISALSFSMTTPAVWVLGNNIIRIQNDTKTLQTLAIRVVNNNTEIYNKITSAAPLDVVNFTASLGEGTNTIYLTFETSESGINVVPPTIETITFYAIAHKQANVASTIVTVTYEDVNTFMVTVTNPFAAVGTYTVFVAGNWDSVTESKVVALLPNETREVLIFASGPSNKEISAYEVTFFVEYEGATVFSTTVPATATTKLALIPGLGNNSDLVLIIAGVLLIIILIIAIRKEGDEL